MNGIVTTVKNIESCDNLYLVECLCEEETISMVSLDIGEEIKVGKKVRLTVNPSNIILTKKYQEEISSSNQLACTILSVENGKILSNIKISFLDTKLEAVITSTSSKKMSLKAGDNIIALINATNISARALP